MNVKLPSDNLSQAELRQKNGEVKAYFLGKPMTWAEIQALPYDVRKTYIERLRGEYKATTIMVAKMAGISVETIRRWCKTWGISFPHTGGHLAEVDRLRWEAFLERKAGEKEKDEKGQGEEKEPTESRQRHERECDQGPVPVAGEMTFQCAAGAALRKVYEILGENACKITVTWEVLDQ